MTELEKLLAEKRELERRIKILTSGSIVHDIVKLDRIDNVCASKYQRGKWALYFRYCFVNTKGDKDSKWVPVYCGKTVEDVVNVIPEGINALTALYEEAKGAKDGTDS